MCVCVSSFDSCCLSSFLRPPPCSLDLNVCVCVCVCVYACVEIHIFFELVLDKQAPVPADIIYIQNTFSLSFSLSLSLSLSLSFSVLEGGKTKVAAAFYNLCFWKINNRIIIHIFVICFVLTLTLPPPCSLEMSIKTVFTHNFSFPSPSSAFFRYLKRECILYIECVLHRYRTHMFGVTRVAAQTVHLRKYRTWTSINSHRVHP